MGDTQEVHNDMMQRLQSSFGTSSSSIPKQSLPLGNQMDITQLKTSQMRACHFPQFAQNFSGDGSKRVGIPPSHPNLIPPVSPHSQIPVSRPASQQMGSQNFSPGPTHSRSLSQPSSFFSIDSLPPLSPATFRDSPSTSVLDPVSMEERDTTLHSVLPPRKAHRRSNSDIPFGFYNVLQSSPPLIPLRGTGGLGPPVPGRERRENAGTSKPAQLIKKESNWERGSDNNEEGMGERKSEGEVVDDLFSAYMNLDNIDALNSSGTSEKIGNVNFEDLDSRASGTKTNGADSSDNEAESSVNDGDNNMLRVRVSSSTDKREGLKRSAGGDIAPTTRHYRSVSMDSFMGKLNFADESPKLPPSPGARPGQLSPSNSIDGNSAAFSLEFGNGEFSGAELKKIMANEKLAEVALTDPKRAKRILANRQSAARSKERKMRYISELEHKVQTLQTEATTLSTQLTLLQRDSFGLTNQNNELKFRIQAMEQQAHLRDALNEALTAEVRRLKLATQEMSGDSDPSKCMRQLPIDPQIFQLQQQASQLNIRQLLPHQQQPVSSQDQQQQQSQLNSKMAPPQQNLKENNEKEIIENKWK